MRGKVALVTGSTSGLGLAVAKEMVAKGCTVVATGLGDDNHIAEIMTELRKCQISEEQEIHFIPVDLSKSSEIPPFVSRVFHHLPNGVDILVNNAAIQHVQSVETFDWSKWEDMLAIHLSAPFLLVQNFLPKMKERGWGRIVNIGSVHSVIGAANKIAYSTTKHGIVGLTKAVALDCAESGVTCNVVCPGLLNTGMATKTIEVHALEKGISFEEAKVPYVKARHPTGKLVEVSQVVGMILFLCSSDAENMTGGTIMMDGGYTAR